MDVQILQLTAATGTTAQALTDVPGLASFALAAGKTYYFRFVGVCTTSATTVGILISVNNSTAITSINFFTKIPTSASAWRFEGALTTLQAGTLPTSGPGSTSLDWYVEGKVVANTAGTFALQIRSETGGAVTLGIGSYGVVERIT